MLMDGIGDVSLTGLLHWTAGRIVWPLYNGLKRAYVDNPSHVILETICIFTIIYLLLHRRFNPNVKAHIKLTTQEEDDLLQEWIPHPLSPVAAEPVKQLIVTRGRINGFVQVLGSNDPKIDFTSYDFLDFSSLESIKAECSKTIVKFGVGSCGPRGFYGTVTPHLLVEEKFARFLGTEAAILYSDALATVSSVIASFSKAGDLIVCDDGVCHDVRCGLTLSRSRIVFFKHNNVDDLERILSEIESENTKSAKWSKHRKFIVVEGIYQNYGDICPLDEIVRLKQKYCYRLILDDSLGFGVLGATGRGTCEMKAVDISEVEIWCCRLDASLASVGGICCGSKQVVEHQQLSGAGYVFSASSAMFTCTAAVKALSLIEEEPQRCATVRRRAQYARQTALEVFGERIHLTGEALSPVLYIRFLDQQLDTSSAQTKFYESLADCMLNYFHTIVGVAKFVPSDQTKLLPGIRIVVSSCHTEQQIFSLMSNLRQSYETQTQLNLLKKQIVNTAPIIQAKSSSS